MFAKTTSKFAMIAASVAFAASNASALSIDTASAVTDVTAAATAIIGVLLVVWGARRVFSFLGR